MADVRPLIVLLIEIYLNVSVNISVPEVQNHEKICFIIIYNISQVISSIYATFKYSFGVGNFFNPHPAIYDNLICLYSKTCVKLPLKNR